MKDIVNGEGVNKFPSNRLDTNVHPLYSILCILLTFFAHLVALINGILQIINGLITKLCSIKIPFFLCISGDKGLRYKIEYLKWERKNNNSGWKTGVGWPKTVKTGWSYLFDVFQLTGNSNNPKDPGDFDGNLSKCDDVRYWVPATYSTNAFTAYNSTSGPYYAPDGWKYSTNYATTIWNRPASPWQFGYGGAPFVGFVNNAGSNSGLYTYNYQDCATDPTGHGGGCIRYRLKEWGSWRESITSCDKKSLNKPCDGVKFLGLCIQLKFQCLFAGLFCQGCTDYCGPDFDCPGGSGCGSSFDCCSGNENKCCMQIPLIGLKCKEENITIKPTIIPSVFSMPECNETFIVPFSCLTCGGLQTPVIKTWVSCVLEPVAVWLKMLKFDFYNDWVGGSLYFPLIKRKYKVRKSKKKFGQIKKDKFCHYNCRSLNASNDPPNFQGNSTYSQHRIKLEKTTYAPVEINIQGCKVNLEGNIVTNWYGDSNSSQNENKDLAAQEISLDGTNDADNNCQISFDDYASLNQVLGNNQYSGLQVLVNTQTRAGVYGEPNYVSTEDAFGYETWENLGGFGMHKNKCDPTRLIERKEYFKDVLDCTSQCPGG